MKQTAIDAKHTWLTEGLQDDFDTFLPMGSEASKKGEEDADVTIFKTYSVGVVTARDAWVFNFNRKTLTENLTQMMDYYNGQVFQWGQRSNREISVNDFIDTDDRKIKWTRSLKSKLKTATLAEFSAENIRTSLYRPFIKSHLYFHRMMNECVYVFPSIFPTPDLEMENRVICVRSPRSNTSFHTLISNVIPDFHFTGDSQCFPFYTYNEDGTNRQENITDWALVEFRKHYSDNSISKWDIFNYTYALLHHPDYREKYQANLKRDLPHIPFAPDFWGFANAGAQLADIHVNYEAQPKYDGLKYIETPNMPIDWSVEKMKLSKDKMQLVYNDFLTIDGIPAEAFGYRLGTRSALEWVIDQYRVKVDKRSGIVNDPNRADQPRYIVDLIGRVISVSLQTVEIVEALPDLVGAVS